MPAALNTTAAAVHWMFVVPVAVQVNAPVEPPAILSADDEVVAPILVWAFSTVCDPPEVIPVPNTWDVPMYKSPVDPPLAVTLDPAIVDVLLLVAAVPTGVVWSTPMR